MICQSYIVHPLVVFTFNVLTVYFLLVKLTDATSAVGGRRPILREELSGEDIFGVGQRVGVSLMIVGVSGR